MSEPNPQASRHLPTLRQAFAAWLTAGLAVLATSTGVAVAAAAVAVSRRAEPEAMLFDPVWVACGTVANELAVAGVLWLWLRKLHLPPAIMLAAGRARRGMLLGAALVVFGLAPAADAAGELARRALDIELTSTVIVMNAVKRSSAPMLAFLVLALAVLPAIVEEAFFRGFLTPIFARRSILAGVLVPSVLFGLFHLEPTQIVGTTVLGIGFGLVRILTGSVALCMLTHGAYNAAVILALTQVPDAPTHEIEPASVALGLAAAIGGAMLLAKTSGRARSVPDRLD